MVQFLLNSNSENINLATEQQTPVLHIRIIFLGMFYILMFNIFNY